MAGVGDEIVVVIRRARPISATALASATAIKVRRGDVRRALVVSLFTLHNSFRTYVSPQVRTKKEVMRPDGRYIRFDDNAAVLLNNKKELLGTRIGGVVSADLRMKGWSKIASLAPKVRHPLFHPGATTLMERACKFIRLYNQYPINNLFALVTMS